MAAARAWRKIVAFFLAVFAHQRISSPLILLEIWRPLVLDGEAGQRLADCLLGTKQLQGFLFLCDERLLMQILRRCGWLVLLSQGAYIGLAPVHQVQGFLNRCA